MCGCVWGSLGVCGCVGMCGLSESGKTKSGKGKRGGTEEKLEVKQELGVEMEGEFEKC